MKLLFLDHPQHTHATWVLYEGLKRVLGWESLVVFPRKEVYHGRDHDLTETSWYREVYQDIADGYELPRGVPPLSPGESLTTGDERTIVCNAGAWVFTTPDLQRPYDEAEVVDLLDAGHFDLVILGNSNRVPTVALARLRDRCVRPLPPVVYLDGGERDEHCAHWTHVFRPALVFKQILTPEVEGQYRGDFVDLHVPLRLWPLPLACPFVNMESSDGADSPSSAQHRLRPEMAALPSLMNMPPGPRPVDVFSHFGPTWPARALLQERVAGAVRRLGVCGVLRGVVQHPNTGLPYYAVIACSRVGVSMRGSGRDTDRYWQIPPLGAALLADGTMGCVHPHPFRDGETAAFYRSLDEAERKLEWLLSDEEARCRIASAGREHLRRFHGVEARALFFLAIVRQEIGVDVGDQQREATAFWRRKLGWDSELPEWRGPVVGFFEEVT